MSQAIVIDRNRWELSDQLCEDKQRRRLMRKFSLRRANSGRSGTKGSRPALTRANSFDPRRGLVRTSSFKRNPVTRGKSFQGSRTAQELVAALSSPTIDDIYSYEDGDTNNQDSTKGKKIARHRIPIQQQNLSRQSSLRRPKPCQATSERFLHVQRQPFANQQQKRCDDHQAQDMHEESLASRETHRNSLSTNKLENQVDERRSTSTPFSDDDNQNKPSEDQAENGELMMQVGPGEFLPMLGSKETWEAYLDGMILPVTCVSCQTELFCKMGAKLVLCSHCRVISPVDSNGYGVGLGLAVSSVDA